MVVRMTGLPWRHLNLVVSIVLGLIVSSKFQGFDRLIVGTVVSVSTVVVWGAALATIDHLRRRTSK